MTTPDSTQACFEQCVREHADSLYRTAYRLMGREELASELVQETYCQAWKNLSQLKSPAKMKSWVFTILRFQYTKFLTREKRQHRQSLEVADEPYVSNPAGTVHTDDIQEALKSLDENSRLPLLLVTMEGFSVQEAAKILEIPRGTVLSRIHRAKQKLKQRLAEYGPETAET